MNASPPIRWVPASLPARIETALQSCLDRWAADWGAPAATGIAVRTLNAGETPILRVAALETPSDTWLATLARALLGPAGPASTVAQGAVRRAVTALQDSLRQRFHASASEVFVPVQIGHGGIEASFELLGLNLSFVLSVAQLESGGWLPASLRPPLRAVTLGQALHDVPVPLTANVGHTSASVTDILRLQPGDILLLAETLDAPLQVTSPGSPLKLTAHLGASSEPTASAQRALRWLASS